LKLGLTNIDAVFSPKIMLAPMFEPVPHSYIAPVASTPPVAVNVVLEPIQIVDIPTTAVGAVDIAMTVILT